MKEIDFIKMSGSGNDFILIDNRRDIIGKNRSRVARRLCERKASIGADGLILIERSRSQNFQMRIFNPDGSEPEMCGNGVRCAALFARMKGIAPSKMRIQTKAGEIRSEIRDRNVRVNMTLPIDIKIDYPLRFEGREFEVSSINTGVPHVVIFTTDLEKIDVEEMGRKIRFHKEYAPQGTNVNFISVNSPNCIYIRTYERGVESETLACGTGATASAIVSGLKGLVKSPVRVKTRGGEELIIHFSKNKSGSINSVALEGRAGVIYKGKVSL